MDDIRTAQKLTISELEVSLIKYGGSSLLGQVRYFRNAGRWNIGKIIEAKSKNFEWVSRITPSHIYSTFHYLSGEWKILPLAL